MNNVQIVFKTRIKNYAYEYQGDLKDGDIKAINSKRYIMRAGNAVHDVQFIDAWGTMDFTQEFTGDAPEKIKGDYL